MERILYKPYKKIYILHIIINNNNIDLPGGCLTLQSQIISGYKIKYVIQLITTKDNYYIEIKRAISHFKF